MATVDECCNQVGGKGSRNLYYQQYLVLVTPPGYPTDTLYIKMIPYVYNIRYKCIPYCDIPWLDYSINIVIYSDAMLEL